jgi:uncharacterized protein
LKTFLKAQWQNLIMANYEIHPSYLLPYVPKGCELDFYQGKTYVSLVGFLFKNTSLFGFPVPLMGTFEEVNLRFYVVRKVGNELRRGVVFINETVPYKWVAWVANKLYKEHYTAVSTRHKWIFSATNKEINYQWKVQSKWNSIQVDASAAKKKMESGSIEEFIFEHYYGYTKVRPDQSLEYKILHPSWEINTIKNYKINCDFAAFYGKKFAQLTAKKPHSVMLAEGSDIQVDWKRVSF